MHGGSTGVTRTEGRARDCSAQTKGSHRAPGSRRLLISECEWKRGEWRLSTDRQRADELVAKKVLERSLSGMTEIACGSKEFAPFPVSPKGKPGRVGSPHAGRHAARQERALGTHRCRRLPPKRAAAPLGIPCECAGAGVGPVRNNRHVYGSKSARKSADAGGSITPKLETALVAKKEKPPRRLDLTVPSHGSHAWVAMQVEPKFLRLFREVAVGDRIDGCNKSPTGGVNARAIM